MIDIHNHLLYGVDDGVKTIEESIDVLKDLYKEGYTDIILTPHYIKNTSYASTISDNYKKLKKLRTKLKEENIDINLYLGNEIFIDDDIYDELTIGRASTMNGTRFILVELPMSGEFEGYIDLFKYLIEKGCKIILAHPERYLKVQDNYEIINELESIGVYFQSNLDSLIGGYGESAMKTVIRLLKDKKISFLATDIHRKKHNYNKWVKAKKVALEYISEDEYNRLTNVNPRELIQNNYYK